MSSHKFTHVFFKFCSPYLQGDTFQWQRNRATTKMTQGTELAAKVQATGEVNAISLHDLEINQTNLRKKIPFKVHILAPESQIF